MRVWLTNDIVAWEIPPGRIASFYLWGVYLSPDGWVVQRELDGDGWHRGECGEMRKELVC